MGKVNVRGLGVFDKDQAHYSNLIEQKVEWVKPWRHGVIRGVKTEEVVELSNALAYFFGSTLKGNNGQWWKLMPDGTYAVEFTHQAKVSPPPTRPWEWEGTTILFKHWMEQERTRKEEHTLLRGQFNLGDKIRFVSKGVRHEGIIINFAKRATVLVGASKWYVPLKMLTREV